MHKMTSAFIFIPGLSLVVRISTLNSKETLLWVFVFCFLGVCGGGAIFCLSVWVLFPCLFILSISF